MTDEPKEPAPKQIILVGAPMGAEFEEETGGVIVGAGRTPSGRPGT